GDAVVLEVVGADLLGPAAPAHLVAPGGGGLLGLAVLLGLQQPGPQHGERLGLVLRLALLVLDRHDRAGGQVRDPHGRVGGVDALAARTGGPVDVDAQVGRVDLDVDLLGLGQHGDRRRRRVDAALALGHRDALDPVGAGLEVHAGPDALALQREDDL